MSCKSLINSHIRQQCLRANFLKSLSTLDINDFLTFGQSYRQNAPSCHFNFHFFERRFCFYFTHWLFEFLCNYLSVTFDCSFAWVVFIFWILISYLKCIFKYFLLFMLLNFTIHVFDVDTSLKILYNHIYSLSLYDFWVVCFVWEAVPSQTYKGFLYFLLIFLWIWFLGFKFNIPRIYFFEYDVGM